MSHRAGFINIVGKPNAGKSTLMNQLVGERLSIITPKAQTTRHRILGILNGDDYQIVLSDTPGYLDPSYPLHQAMMGFVREALEDADVLLYLIDASDSLNEELTARVVKADCKKIILLNKVDTQTPEQVQQWMDKLNALFPEEAFYAISALHHFNKDSFIDLLKAELPEHPAFYDKDALTDKPERFFASEIIREKIFLHYDKEIPYSCEVAIIEFKEEAKLIRISAEIMVERDSQKGILIGHKGAGLKKTGTAARFELEKFFGKKIFLETFVKVKPNWRSDQRLLNQFGYQNPS